MLGVTQNVSGCQILLGFVLCFVVWITLQASNLGIFAKALVLGISFAKIQLC